MARDPLVDDIIAGFRDYSKGGIYLPEQLQNEVARVLGELYQEHYEASAITDAEGKTESIYSWLKSSRGLSAVSEIAGTDVTGMLKQLPGLNVSSDPGNVPNWIARSVGVPKSGRLEDSPFYNPSVGTFEYQGQQRIPIPQEIRAGYWNKTRQGLLSFQNAQTGSDLTRLLLESSRGIIAQSAAFGVRERGLDPTEALTRSSLNLSYRMATFSPTYQQGTQTKQSSWPMWAAFGGRQTNTDMIQEATERKRLNIVSLDALGGEGTYYAGQNIQVEQLSYIDRQTNKWVFPSLLTTTGRLHTQGGTQFANVVFDPFGQGKKGYKPLELSARDVRSIGYYVSHGNVDVFAREGRAPGRTSNLDKVLQYMQAEIPEWTERRHALTDEAESEIEFNYRGGGGRGDFTQEEANIAYLQRRLDERNARVRREGITTWEDPQGNPITGDILNAPDPRARTTFVTTGGREIYEDPFGDTGYDASLRVNYGYKQKGGRWIARWGAGKGPANPMEAFEQGKVTHGLVFRSQDRDLIRSLEKGEELTLRGHDLAITGTVSGRAVFGEDISDERLEKISKATGIAPGYIREQLKRSGEGIAYRFNPELVEPIDEDVMNMTPAEYAEFSRQKKLEAAEALASASDTPGSIAAKNILASREGKPGQFRDEYEQIDPQMAAMERAMYAKLRPGVPVQGSRGIPNMPSEPPFEPTEADMAWLREQEAAGAAPTHVDPRRLYKRPSELLYKHTKGIAKYAPTEATQPPLPGMNVPASEAISRNPLSYESWVSGEASRVLYKGERLRDVVGNLSKPDQSNIVSFIRSQRHADRVNEALDAAYRADRIEAAGGDPGRVTPRRSEADVSRAMRDYADTPLAGTGDAGNQPPQEPPTPPAPPAPPPDDEGRRRSNPPELGDTSGSFIYNGQEWINQEAEPEEVERIKTLMRRRRSGVTFQELANEAPQPSQYAESMVPSQAEGGRSWQSITDEQFRKFVATGASRADPTWLAGKYQDKPPHSLLGTPHVAKKDELGGIEELEFVEPNSIVRGRHQFTEREDYWGRRFKILSPEQEGLTTKTSSAVIGQAYHLFQSSLGSALMGADTSQGGQNAIANLRASIDKYANDYVKQMIKDAGTDPEAIRQASETGDKIKTLVREFTDETLDQAVREGKSEKFGDLDWRGIQSTRLYKGSDIRRLAQAYPEFGDWVEEQGGVSAVLKGRPQTFTTLKGRNLTVGMGGWDDTGGDFGGPGGGGPPGRGPTGRGGLWGGRMGSLLYGAYVGKRLWSWTAGASIQEAEAYGQYVSSMAPSIGGIAAMQPTGYEARQQLGRMWMAEGAYEQFGGFSTGLYSLSGGSTFVPRTAAGLKLAGGLAAGGYTTAVGASVMAQMGGGGATMAAGGAAAGAGMIALGAGAVASLAGMEVYNAFFKPEGMQNMTFGNIFQNFLTEYQYNLAKTKYGIENPLEAIKSKLPVFGTQAAAKQLMEQDYLSREAYYSFVAARAPINQELEQLKETTSIVSAITGSKPEEIQPFVRNISRITGGMDQPMFEQMAMAAQGMGMTFGEYSQMFASTISTMGIRSGTDQARYVAQQFAGFQGFEEAEAFAAKQSVYARYGAMLSPYSSSSAEATRLARTYGIETMAQAQGLTSLAAVANMYGMDLAEVVSTSTMHERDGRTVTARRTVGDELAEMSARLGPVRSMVAGQAADFLTGYGVPIQEALGFVEQYGVQDRRQWGRAQTMIQMAGQYTNDLSQEAMGRLAEAGMKLTEYQTGQIGSILQRVAPGTSGDNLAQLAEILASSGMSNADMFRLNNMMSGDIKAWSYDAFQRGTYQGRFTDMAGRPIYMSSLNDFMQMSNAQFNAGNPYARAGYDTYGFLGMQSVGDTQAAQAWMEGGQLGREMLHRQRMRGYDVMRMDLAQEQLTSDIGYTQQMWGLQDQQRALSHQSQLASFGAAWRRLDVNQAYGLAQEDLSFRQMMARHQYGDITAGINLRRLDLREYFGERQADLSRQGFESRQAWQMYSMQFGRENALLQRQWTQADWQYSDQMRGLQFGWGMEDINEQIRRSTGYQRRQLIKQRERMVLTQNLEEGHIDEQRERQEEMWAREDEHYEKLKTYTEQQMALEKEQFELNEDQRKQLMELDREAFEAQEKYRQEMQAFEKEQFELSKQQRQALYELEREELARRQEEYMRQYALQEQIINLQRQHQQEQWDFQQRSLDINRMIADENWKYQMELANVSNLYSAIVGHFQMMSAYDPTFQLSQLVGFIQQINSLDPYRLMLLSNIMATMR